MPAKRVKIPKFIIVDIYPPDDDNPEGVWELVEEFSSKATAKKTLKQYQQDEQDPEADYRLLQLTPVE